MDFDNIDLDKLDLSNIDFSNIDKVSDERLALILATEITKAGISSEKDGVLYRITFAGEDTISIAKEFLKFLRTKKR